MKHFLLIIMACVGLIFAPPAAHAQDYIVGSARDTAKPNTTKRQKLAVVSPGGITVSYKCTQITDTITGYVSLWASLNDTTYFPWPGADSFAIAAATNLEKGWFLRTPDLSNPIKWLEVRTRCPSNTTNATGKAKVDSRLRVYK